MSLWKVSFELDLASPSVRNVVYDVLADSKDEAVTKALANIAPDVEIVSSTIELVTG